MGALQYLGRARKGLKVAEMLLSRTYPASEDTKIFLAAIEDIYFALVECVQAMFVIKGVEIPKEIDDLIEEFSDFSDALGFTANHLETITKLHKIITAHQESPVEFARKDGFVICEESYAFRKLTMNDMQKYLFDARLFMEKAVLVGEKSKDE